LIDKGGREIPESVDSIFDLQILIKEQEPGRESWWGRLDEKHDQY